MVQAILATHAASGALIRLAESSSIASLQTLQLSLIAVAATVAAVLVVPAVFRAITAARQSRQALQQAQQRIDRVAHRYWECLQSIPAGDPRPTSLYLLIQAGALELASEPELEEACRRILDNPQAHANWVKTYPPGRLLEFLRFCEAFEHPLKEPAQVPFAVAMFAEKRAGS